jgi:hypothetical protein
VLRVQISISAALLNIPKTRIGMDALERFPGKIDVVRTLRAYDAHKCIHVCRVEIVRPDKARHDICWLGCQLEKRGGSLEVERRLTEERAVS